MVYLISAIYFFKTFFDKLTHLIRKTEKSHSLQGDIYIYLYVCVCVCELLSLVQLFVTPWTVVHQAPLSIGFPRREY